MTRVVSMAARDRLIRGVERDRLIRGVTISRAVRFIPAPPASGGASPDGTLDFTIAGNPLIDVI